MSRGGGTVSVVATLKEELTTPLEVEALSPDNLGGLGARRDPGSAGLSG